MTAEELLELARRAHDEHGSQQKPWELATFGGIILDREYLSAVEVGTYAGGTAWFLHQLGLELTVVDANLSRCPRLEGVRYLEGDSATLAEKVNQPVDVVFIDGDHSYHGAQRDWLAYYPKVNPRGMIAFHDIVAHPPELGCHVDQLWAEFRTGPGAAEIIDRDDTSDWGGIGVVFL